MTAILLLESDAVVRTPLAEYLRDCGYQVLEANGVAEAKEVLAEGSKSIKAVLVAIDGRVDGFSFASWVRGNHGGIDVILAATVTKAAEKAGELCKDNLSVAKPYDHQAVLDQIKRLVAKQNSRDLS
jgi:DNA-binding NtrC family response regulator